MHISGISLHADKGVVMTVHLQPTAAVIVIRDGGRHQFSAASIFLPVADFERAERAVEAFNREISAQLSEPDAPRLHEAAE